MCVCGGLYSLNDVFFYRERIHHSRTTLLLTINSHLRYIINYDNKHSNKHGINQSNTMPINVNYSSKVAKQHPSQSTRTSTLMRIHWKLLNNVLQRAFDVLHRALLSDTFCLLFLCCLKRATFIPCVASFKTWFNPLVKPHLPHIKHLINCSKP